VSSLGAQRGESGRLGRADDHLTFSLHPRVRLEMSIDRQRGAEVHARLESPASEQGVRHQRLDETAPSRREAPRDRSRRPQDPGLVVEGNPAWAHWVNRETGEHALQPLKGDEPNSEANEDVE